MIGISKLYGGIAGQGDTLRYGGRSGMPRPVVVWNMTSRCNLRCAHCYADAGAADDRHAMPDGAVFRMLDNLAGYGVPALLLSGGEPLLHPRFFDYARGAARRGLRTAVSTNGTTIDAARARRLRAAGVGYVGISLDGLGALNDRFRGVPGAFDAALAGIRACRDAGVRVGLRFTITRLNAADASGVLDLAEAEGLDRICFYHLAYSGRGGEMAADDLDHAAARGTLDLLMDRVRAPAAAKSPVELLTVGNHADGAYLLMRLAREDPLAAARAHALLRRNGGNASGERIACVGWDGQVYPDQFWRTRPVGDATTMPFGEIWSAPAHPLLEQLRDRKSRLRGRCASCRWLDICNGNLRARAEAATGDIWAPDPGCYLTDGEIALET